MDRTELSTLGEFGLIKLISEGVKPVKKSTKMGIGDDAAVIQEGDQFSLLTTDMLMEGVHFDLSYAPLKHLGYKAAIANFSDIFAMNGVPEQILVSLGLSNRFSVEAIEELYAGIKLACEIYEVDMVGGDTVSSKSGLVISITARGVVEQNKIAYRSGAKDKDILVVSGDLGAAYMGLQVLEREKAVYESTPGVQPDLEGYDYILERQLKPEARKDVVKLLDQVGVVPTSMIDISDGLASETLHLADRSEMGLILYEEKIPIDPTVINTAEKFNIDPTLCALNGGEDYELLFTISQGDFEKLKGNPNFSFIGHVSEGSASQMIARDGSAHELTAQGWDAFIKAKKENL
ncbi:MAG: thiamine-phosphate kinase [Cryomorphaceae bacterium]|nr:thiamine-phosphate kinase [Flavobacteriales bacterium]